MDTGQSPNELADASGNTASIGDATFVFYDRNRLRDYKADGTIVTRSYRYNGKGERVAKIDPTEPANNRYYFYDEAGHLLGEYLADGTRVQEYVWLDDTLVAVLSDHDGSTYQFVETDHLGTPRAVIHPSKNTIIWRWDLSETAFGEHSPIMDPDSNTIGYTLNLRYPGQYADSESQLNYNYFRDYESATGRYIESDPIGLRGGINTYAYAYGDPTLISDPLGLAAGCRLKVIESYKDGATRKRVIARKRFGIDCKAIPKISKPEPSDLLPDAKSFAHGRLRLSIPSPLDFDYECDEVYFRTFLVERARIRIDNYYEICTDSCGNTTSTFIKPIENTQWVRQPNEYDFHNVKGISTASPSEQRDNSLYD